MQILSFEPFVPSGRDYDQAKKFFIELGFNQKWDAGDYTGFEKNGFSFILQRFDNKDFAENFMLSVGVPDVEEFRKEVLVKQLPEKFGIRLSEVKRQAYGKEVNLIDPAGVCWHFVQAE